jgi:transposase
MATNIMFGYSLAAGLANYYRLLPGNIKDVKAFKICAQEYGCTNMTAIVDKGFQSDENIKFIDSMEGVSVIMALRRNTAGLDYTPFANRDNKGALGHFWYGGRVIWYHKQEVYGHTVYLYLDEKRRVEEQEDYLAKADDAENDHYTMESYNEHVMQFGTIALLVTQEKSAEDTYYAYKSRGEVEQCIDVFKNTLEADTSYMQTEQALETWMFINMVAMHWYCELRQRMVDSKLIEKYSPRDMIRVMGRLRSVYVNGKWHTTEITAKEGRLLSAIGVDIT